MGVAGGGGGSAAGGGMVNRFGKSDSSLGFSGGRAVTLNHCAVFWRWRGVIMNTATPMPTITHIESTIAMIGRVMGTYPRFR